MKPGLDSYGNYCVMIFCLCASVYPGKFTAFVYMYKCYVILCSMYYDVQVLWITVFPDVVVHGA